MKKKLIAGISAAGIVIGLVWVLSGSGKIPVSGLEIGAGSKSAPEPGAVAGNAGALETKSGPDQPAGSGGDAAGLSAGESRKLSILSEIIASKNDNDQRFDAELRNFSPALKSAIFRKYADAPAERRNERGTYVFLIGREIKDAADVGFLKSVLMENPCLSLENCERAPEGQGGDEEHLGAINETTANYPQLVAIRAIRHKLVELREQGQESSALFSGLLQALREIRVSPNPRVVDEAAKTLKELDSE